MSVGDVLSLFGDALGIVVVIVAILVLPSLFVGLIVAVFQAATQINEQTLSFLPRLIMTLVSMMQKQFYKVLAINGLRDTICKWS